MPLMDGAPSRPDRTGPAKVIATAIEMLARAVVPARVALLLASPKTRGGQVLVRRLDCEREARERPMDGRRSDFRGQGWSSE